MAGLLLGLSIVLLVIAAIAYRRMMIIVRL